MEERISGAGKQRTPAEDEAVPERNPSVCDRLADGASPGQVGEGDVRENWIAHRADHFGFWRVLPRVVPVVEIRRPVDTPGQEGTAGENQRENRQGQACTARHRPYEAVREKEDKRRRGGVGQPEKERLGFQRRVLRRILT